MADAAGRREARRKRILENCHNRLELIAGKISSEDCSRDPSRKSYSGQIFESLASPSTDTSTYLPPVNNGLLAEPDAFALLSEAINPVAAGDTQSANDLAGFTLPSTETVKKKSLLEKLVSYKYDILLLAIINQIFYCMFSFEPAYFFLPLVIYSVTKLIWFPAQSNLNIANAVLLMNGISANKSRKILSIFKWFAEITQDICVYLFITICIQSLLIVLNQSIIIT